MYFKRNICCFTKAQIILWENYMILISPSILGANFASLSDEINRVKNAQMLHIDVMDGHFVPNISVGVPVVKSIHAFCEMFLDVHLMISNPLDYVEAFAEAGADLICFHLEASSDITATIKKIRAVGKKVGISLKPNTEASEVFDYIKLIDMVLVMTVEPGFGGQAFMPEMLTKISQIRAYATEQCCPLDIQVDGGINLQTGKQCVQAGANVLVAGSFLFDSDNPAALVEKLQSL